MDRKTRPDKYNEKASALSDFVCACGGREGACPRLAAVAQFGRECAAAAFDEAQLMMLTAMPAKVHDLLQRKAAELRRGDEDHKAAGRRTFRHR